MTDVYQPLILAEDEALKRKLQGVKVTDRTAPEGMDVRVWYRLPEGELQERAFPYITLDLIGINHATEREHRGRPRLERDIMYTVPPGTEWDDEAEARVTDYPIPLELIYQITTWSRFAAHDRQIMGALLGTDRIPYRFGRLEVNDTTRRLDLVSITTADTRDENNKRLFRKIYTVTVSSEMFPAAVEQVMRAIEVVHTVIPSFETFTLENETAP